MCSDHKLWYAGKVCTTRTTESSTVGKTIFTEASVIKPLGVEGRGGVMSGERITLDFTPITFLLHTSHPPPNDVFTPHTHHGPGVIALDPGTEIP